MWAFAVCPLVALSLHIFTQSLPDWIQVSPRQCLSDYEVRCNDHGQGQLQLVE